MEEYYLHFAGLKEDFDLEAIYERYADLTDVEQAKRIGGGGDRQPGGRGLWEISCGGYLAALTRGHTPRGARPPGGPEAEGGGEEGPAPRRPAAFPQDKMLPALQKTLEDLGVDLRRQENVELDVEKRPQKTPRAFCAPIEVPGRVVLVIQPVGGPDDWRALFHEAGHTEHFANTSPDLPIEWRRLGGHAGTEGWGSP